MATFLILGTAMLAAAVILSFAAFGSVDGFMERARTPHFMQMHLGTLDSERMQGFVDGRSEVEDWEAIELLNVENSQLSFNGETLDTEIQQNSFVRQPETMDYLLSPDGEVIDPQPGDIYIPFFYEDKYDLQTGQHVTVQTRDGEVAFTIAGFFRDSQMNSTLASSKRLLISDGDFADLKEREGTTPEYLISFRLTSSSAAGGFEAAYFDAGLESNGPSLNWSLFRLINSINDAVTVLLFLLMTFIILLVLGLCIRYALLTSIEEDLHDIGVMKALGIANTHIRDIYLGKYRILLGSGAAIGIVLALIARNSLVAGVQRRMGDVNYPVLGIVAGIIGAILMYLLAMAYVRRVLRKLRVITPLQALHGSANVTGRRRPRPVISPTTGVRVNLKMAWARIRRAPGNHLTVLVVACLITLVLLIPFRFGTTMRSADFVTYMGIGEYDVRVDLLNRDDALGTADAITSGMEGDDRIERMETYTLEVETVLMPDGQSAPLRIDYGDTHAFPLQYGEGRAPQAVEEVGLSDINAERLQVSVGDTLTVDGPEGPVTFTVSGTYQDVTNGGKTAKALPGVTMDDPEASVMMAVNVKDGSDVSDVISTIRDIASDAQVIDTETYVRQMMGDMMRVIDTVSWVFTGVALVMSALIAGLSIRLMQVQERKANAIQNALGFTAAHLRLQYLSRIMGMMLIGVLLGVVLSTPVGNLFGNLTFSAVGVSGLSTLFSPVVTLLGSVLVLGSALVITLINTTNTNQTPAERLRA